MADTKISALTALAGASVDTAADVIPIVDTSATTTKKILVDELRIAIGIATQAQQETGSSNVVFVTPGRQQYHASAAKAWIRVSTDTVDASHNVSSLTDNGTGDHTINFTTAFSSAYYGMAALTQWVSISANVDGILIKNGVAPTASACRIITLALINQVLVDNIWSAAFFGDQA